MKIASLKSYAGLKAVSTIPEEVEILFKDSRTRGVLQCKAPGSGQSFVPVDGILNHSYEVPNKSSLNVYMRTPKGEFWGSDIRPRDVITDATKGISMFGFHSDDVRAASRLNFTRFKWVTDERGKRDLIRVEELAMKFDFIN